MSKLVRTAERILPRHVFAVMRRTYHFALACAAAIRYGFPSHSLIVIGVTGTKGKTTTVGLLHQILEGAGYRVASSSSLRFRINDKETPNMLKMTMPGRFALQHFLYDAKRAGCTHVIIEVTSEGIVQSRHRFIRFDIAVLTNIAREHLESHGGFESYVRAKLDLFWRLRRSGAAVINEDDPLAIRVAGATHAHHVSYGKHAITRGMRKYPVRLFDASASGITLSIAQEKITIPLAGEFNGYNVLAAVATGIVLHIPLRKIATGLMHATAPEGRVEYVAKEPFAVVVDYAHTPDSLEKLYDLFGRENCPLICVLGAAGGGRDKWKRPEFGSIAAARCRDIILTNEDPYDEDPEKILKDIEKGIPKQKKHKKIIDRRRAIHEAIKLARPGDAVLITGKGAEPWLMGKNGKKTPWDDRAIARDALARMSAQAPADE